MYLKGHQINALTKMFEGNDFRKALTYLPARQIN